MPMRPAVLAVGGGDHMIREQVVSLAPRGGNAWRPVRSEPLFEAPEQRIADDRIVLRADAELDVLQGQPLGERFQICPVVQTRHHHRQGGNELALLLFHVAAEERPDKYIARKQSAVEQLRGARGGGPNLIERAPHALDLVVRQTQMFAHMARYAYIVDPASSS